MPRLELRQTDQKAVLLLDGMDIANAVSSVEIYSAGPIPRVVLHPLVFELDTEFDSANVEIPEQTHALLVRLGWTPPVQDGDSQ